MSKLKKNSFLQGTLIASFSLILIKVLGALYVIPYYKIIGESGGTLYSYAYSIYNLFLNISTAGIPIAMSMLISEYLALEKYDAKERAYNVGKKIIFSLSFIAFVIVFFGSNILAKFILSDSIGGHSIEDVSLVIKSIAPCLLIIPFLSVLRGYMQGHKFIAPTSFAQLLEQVVRIIVVLVGSYFSIKILNMKVSLGVAISLTGTFFGGLFSFLYLKRKVNKNKSEFPLSDKKDNISNKEIAKKILLYCIPIVLISVTDNIYTLVDIKLIIKGLNMVGYTALESQTISGIVSTWAPKICAIIVTISIALTTNIIPHVTECYAKNDFDGVKYRINQALSTMLFITIPMQLVLFLVSDEAYFIFYGNSNYGGLILKFSTISHVFLGIWSVLNTSLQSMRKFKEIYKNSLAGLITNAVLDIPLIILFDKFGLNAYVATIVSTCIGYSVSIIMSLVFLRKSINAKYTETLNILKKLIIPSIIITIPFLIFKSMYQVNLTILNSFITIIVFGIYSVLVYLFITYKNKSLECIFGKESIDKILRKLHIKKEN